MAIRACGAGVPAAARFFDNDYLPACRYGIAACGLPVGDDFYADRARHFTTTKLTPEQIHEIGLKEVARIRGEMDEVIKKVGFKGSFADFVHFLRTDPQFYYKTPDELLAAYRAGQAHRSAAREAVRQAAAHALRRRADPRRSRPTPPPPTTRALRWLPRRLLLRQPLPAGDAPKYEMEALTLHEAVPGHHLQIALARSCEVPAFRRTAGFTAFVEGWGLYAESLGDEMGLYKDPYSKFGQLTYEMWRAVRLVVDTGMHSKGWTRSRRSTISRRTPRRPSWTS